MVSSLVTAGERHAKTQPYSVWGCWPVAMRCALWVRIAGVKGAWKSDVVRIVSEATVT